MNVCEVKFEGRRVGTARLDDTESTTLKTETAHQGGAARETSVLVDIDSYLNTEDPTRHKPPQHQPRLGDYCTCVGCGLCTGFYTATHIQSRNNASYMFTLAE